MARVLVIGDTHCPCMRDDYIEFLKQIERTWNCDRVVHIGDVVDLHSFSYHERDPDLPSPGEELALARIQVDRLNKAFPRVTVMTGNHDSLGSRQAKSAGLPMEIIRSPKSFLKTKGWSWKHPRMTISIDKVIYAHGDIGFGGKQAAIRNAGAQHGSYVQGHLHTQAGVWWSCNERRRWFGMSVGTGIDRHKRAFYYAKGDNEKPMLGCGVVLDGEWACFEPMLL